jgi:hypothetical protein
MLFGKNSKKKKCREDLFAGHGFQAAGIRICAEDGPWRGGCDLCVINSKILWLCCHVHATRSLVISIFLVSFTSCCLLYLCFYYRSPSPPETRPPPHLSLLVGVATSPLFFTTAHVDSLAMKKFLHLGLETCYLQQLLLCLYFSVFCRRTEFYSGPELTVVRAVCTLINFYRSLPFCELFVCCENLSRT